MLLSILLDAAAQPSAASGGMSSLFLIVVLIAIFYFFMIRPQQKRQKKIREERAKLEKGSKVITQGGIYGRVKEVRDTEFVIEVADGVRISVDKNCVYPAADSDVAVQDGQAAAQQK